MGVDITTIREVSQQEAEAAIINSISHKYKEERQESKAPTFALTRCMPLGFSEGRALGNKHIKVHG